MHNRLIDWDSLPDWAQYASMDAGGIWYCYHAKPFVFYDLGKWGRPLVRWTPIESPSITNIKWEQSLFARPV